MSEENETVATEEKDLECNEEVCEGQQGLDAFCDAVSGEEAKTKCGEVMGMLKQGEIDADATREKLILEIGEESYEEGAIGLQSWLEDRIPSPPEESVESVEPVEPVESVEPMKIDESALELRDEVTGLPPLEEMVPVADDFAEGGFLEDKVESGELLVPEIVSEQPTVELNEEIIEPEEELKPALVSYSYDNESGKVVPTLQLEQPSEEPSSSESASEEQ